MVSAVKEARLDLRLTAAQKETIERAAHITGSTLAGYATIRLVETAENDIARSRAITVSAADWDILVALLDEPDGPKWKELRNRTPGWATA